MSPEYEKKLCVENLALKLSQSGRPCDQPDRTPLDYAIAERMVNLYPDLNPICSACWSDDLDADTFERAYGEAVWNRYVPRCGIAIETLFATAFFGRSNHEVVQSSVRHFMIQKLAKLFYDHLCVERQDVDRAKLDWESAATIVDAAGCTRSIIQRNASLRDLYDYSRFHEKFGKNVWRDIYVNLLSLYPEFTLPKEYTFVRRCATHKYGCLCPDNLLVRIGP